MERLPDWGFQQLEVSCIVEGTKPKTLWKIDQHENELCKLRKKEIEIWG
jgi:dolichyl-phosphate-mannose-protein mannosyltransferase